MCLRKRSGPEEISAAKEAKPAGSRPTWAAVARGQRKVAGGASSAEANKNTAENATTNARENGVIRSMYGNTVTISNRQPPGDNCHHPDLEFAEPALDHRWAVDCAWRVTRSARVDGPIGRGPAPRATEGRRSRSGSTTPSRRLSASTIGLGIPRPASRAGSTSPVRRPSCPPGRRRTSPHPEGRLKPSPSSPR